MNSNKNISNFGGAVKLDFSNCGMDSSDAKVLAELLGANIAVQGPHLFAAAIAENSTITSVSYQKYAFSSPFSDLSFPFPLCFLYSLGYVAPC